MAVVPATFNTINQSCAGVNDTFALNVLNEALGSRLPIIIARTRNLPSPTTQSSAGTCVFSWTPAWTSFPPRPSARRARISRSVGN
ncbi:hypothetical protein [Polymorphospora rubra]|uniref:hypothetical protein n=1 Tax=Polymorphospora rubra TaxID=338584 RepID=UPI003CD0A73A